MSDITEDFSLEKSRWYNTMKLGLHCKYVKQEAEGALNHSRVLCGFPFDPVMLTELANSETSLSEALFAIKIAKAEYERLAAPNLQAAE